MHERANTICPRSSYPFYIVTHYIEWVTNSWTHSSFFNKWSLHFLSRTKTSIRLFLMYGLQWLAWSCLLNFLWIFSLLVRTIEYIYIHETALAKLATLIRRHRSQFGSRIIWFIIIIRCHRSPFVLWKIRFIIKYFQEILSIITYRDFIYNWCYFLIIFLVPLLWWRQTGRGHTFARAVPCIYKLIDMATLDIFGRN